MRNDVEGNIVKYYLYKLFANSSMRGPILVMFMTTTCKMPLSEVYFCEACCVIILAALQIPMGILADRWGRVKTIRIGCLFIVLELLGFATSREHIQLWISNALWAIGLSMLDGAETAMIYDSLKQGSAGGIELTNKSRRLEGRAASMSPIITAVLCLLSVPLIAIDIRIPLIIDTVLIMVSFVISFTFVEPTIHNNDSHRVSSWREVYQNTKVVILRGDILWIIIFATLIAVTAKLWFFTYNPYFEMVGLDLKYFGLVFAAINVVFAISSFFADRIAHKLDSGIGVITSISILTVPVIIMGTVVSKWSISLVLGQNIVRGYIGPFVNEMLNRRIDSVNRATIHSAKSAVHKAVEVLCMGGFGLLISGSSLGTALTCLGVTSSLFGIALMFYYSKLFRK